MTSYISVQGLQGQLSVRVCLIHQERTEDVRFKGCTNKQDVETYLSRGDDVKKREACIVAKDLMEEVPGVEPQMLGNSIVGFGRYHYKYESGREGDWFLTGFAPQKKNLTLYIMSGFSKYNSPLSELGKYSTGKSCLYMNKIEDIDLDVLRELVERSVEHVRKTNA